MLSVAVILVTSSPLSVRSQERAPTLVVMPFTTAGRPADSIALAGAADRLTRELNKLLWADSTVRWVVYRARQRPQDPRTGFVVAPQYNVIGALRAGPGDSGLIRVQLVAVQSMDLVVRDSVATILGEELDHAPRIARLLVAALHRYAARSATARADTIPVEAVQLVARATELATLGDTAAAVAALRQVFVIVPRWSVPCTMLRQLQPGEQCPL
ncbi:MAG TPA: hypothetical protein VD793_00660 [Gemmatimonadales bacterium]|nr:hypothetical protein [Gemmatimonadales bacterium]